MSILRLISRAISTVRLYGVNLLFGHKITLSGKIKEYDVALDTKLRVGNNGNMVLGCFSSENNVHLTAWGGKLEIGNGCSFNRNDIIVAREYIKIGEGTLLGPNVCIYDHDHKYGGNGIIQGEYNYSKVIIGTNVWVGAGAIILRGVNIGDNSIIGAGCIITKNIPANSLVYSNQSDMIIRPLENKKQLSRGTI